MRRLKHIFERNAAWAERVNATRPTFFAELSEQQRPGYLWIGCSDSRVPATEITDLRPGDVFVHRNVANLVVHTDLNCLSVLQYAVEVLKVEHVIVCGHFGCGGVAAALGDQRLGLIDNWLLHIRDVAKKYADVLDDADTLEAKADLLCQLNVIDQVVNVGRTTIVQEAWERGQPLCLHAWIYRLSDGILHDLGLCVDAPDQLAEAERTAVSAIRNGVHQVG